MSTETKPRDVFAEKLRERAVQFETRSAYLGSQTDTRELDLIASVLRQIADLHEQSLPPCPEE